MAEVLLDILDMLLSLPSSIMSSSSYSSTHVSALLYNMQERLRMDPAPMQAHGMMNMSQQQPKHPSRHPPIPPSRWTRCHNPSPAPELVKTGWLVSCVVFFVFLLKSIPP